MLIAASSLACLNLSFVPTAELPNPFKTDGPYSRAQATYSCMGRGPTRPSADARPGRGAAPLHGAPEPDRRTQRLRDAAHPEGRADHLLRRGSWPRRGAGRAHPAHGGVRARGDRRAAHAIPGRGAGSFCNHADRPPARTPRTGRATTRSSSRPPRTSRRARCW